MWPGYTESLITGANFWFFFFCYNLDRIGIKQNSSHVAFLCSCCGKEWKNKPDEFLTWLHKTEWSWSNIFERGVFFCFNQCVITLVQLHWLPFKAVLDAVFRLIKMHSDSDHSIAELTDAKCSTRLVQTSSLQRTFHYMSHSNRTRVSHLLVLLVCLCCLCMWEWAKPWPWNLWGVCPGLWWLFNAGDGAKINSQLFYFCPCRASSWF